MLGTLVQVVAVTVCDDLRLRRAQHWLELLIWTALYAGRFLLGDVNIDVSVEEVAHQSPKRLPSLGWRRPPMKKSGERPVRTPVIPAKAGIQSLAGAFQRLAEWIPAFAGMTASRGDHV
jgi:hypothetical protein